MSTLTLEQASISVDRALTKGREIHSPPLTAAVLDAAGRAKQDTASVCAVLEEIIGIKRGPLA